MSRQQVMEDGGRGAAGDHARQRVLAGAPVTERRLDLAGVSTAVLERGDGPPVVLLHGQGGWAGMWLPVVPELSSSHRVVAPDLPGLGASQVPGGPPDAVGVLRWLDELIERTCQAPPALVGASLGGSIAARFAIARPPSVRAANRRLLRELGTRTIPPEELARLAIPAALVWGRHDRVMRLRIAERASVRFGWPLHVVEDAGHFSLEQPEACRAALRAALGQQRR